ncbi:MAG: CsbD family protein [Rhodospirillales bacterium]|nr:CsbD family protein [Rhodospirillales bacterium]
MDKDRIKGAAKEVSGSIKEAAGKVTGDRETEAEGKVEKNVGTAQNAFGKVKDAIRNA